ncbi:hypothetical protein WDV85_10490 [Pseudokineococcus sp. 5B2Z-1]|uniref:hypothetical protein n=1 Tax=Pseudokineococcus sp. 5B2Z-1 TaxID=3132744 RepID=UPI00309F0A48
MAALVFALSVLVVPPLLEQPADPSPRWVVVLRDEVVLGTLRVSALLLVGLAFTSLRSATTRRRPGPIVVRELTTASQGEDCSSPDCIPPSAEVAGRATATFREALASMRVSVPTSIPGSSGAGEGVVEEVRQAATTASSPWAMLVHGLAGLVAPAAYRVAGTIHHRAGPGHCWSVVIDVSGGMSGALGTTITARGVTAEAAAKTAANAFGAWLVPRTRLGSRPPWSWHQGVSLDPRLFEAYRTGEARLGERRLEEALGAFRRACALDPGNLYVRYRVGLVEELMGRRVAALATYSAALDAGAELDRRVWNRLRRPVAQGHATGTDGAGIRRPWRYGVLVSKPDVLLLLRYRLVCLLAASSHLADDWRQRQDREHRMTRETLTDWLREPVRQIVKSAYPNAGRESPTPSQQAALECVDLEGHGCRLEWWFRVLAADEARELVRDYAWWRGRRRGRSAVSQAAVTVLAPWSTLQLLAAEARLGLRARSDMTQIPTAWGRRVLGSPAPLAVSAARAGAGWCDVVDGMVRTRSRRAWQRLRSRSAWQEHYNLACTYAVAMELDEDSAHRGELAHRAIRHLQIAVATTDSQFVSARADWLASEDDDLHLLRRQPEFARFLWLALPGSVGRRPRSVSQLLRHRHRVAVLLALSRHRAAVLGGDREAFDDETWRREDDDAWRLLAQVASDTASWKERVLVVEQLRPAHRALAVYPTYADEPMSTWELASDAHGTERLADLLDRAAQMSTDVRTWHLRVVREHAQLVPGSRVAAAGEAERRRALWSSTATLLEALLDPVEEGWVLQCKPGLDTALHAWCQEVSAVSGSPAVLSGGDSGEVETSCSMQACSVLGGIGGSACPGRQALDHLSRGQL